MKIPDHVIDGALEAANKKLREVSERIIRTAAAPQKVTSDFAILDIQVGRKKLAKHFKARPPLGPCPQEMRIPVVITGYIDCVHGGDDGHSQEFSVTVESVCIDKGGANEQV